ncbi:acyltransferase 3 [Granulicella sibirica]|uniref:Acyltransferase 3 n=1 Tax=Granulicella sibirica TaxID=2479048 RepID=A0A4Q0SVW8_9BACT|nr:acyltransferase 3 [Granulicella sibirica]
MELDSLRGAAAVIVVINHLGLAFSYRIPRILAPFFAGHAAVVLFFVLSGFVLSLPFWNKGENGSYGPYLIRRFFRIYVPFAASVILAAICAHFFLFSQLPLGDWFKETWQTPLTPSFLFSQFLLPHNSRLNTAFWSLRYEVQLSIAFPLLLLVIRKLGPWLSLTLAVVTYLVGSLVPSHLPDSHWYQETLRYGAVFVFGAVVAWQRETLRKLWLTSPAPLKMASAVVGALMLGYGYDIMFHLRLHSYSDIVVTIGACSAVLLALSYPPFQTFLRLPALEYLGRISYSLYLVHGTLLFVALNLLYGKVPRSLLVTLFLLVTWAVSHAFCVFLEEPSLRFGKRIATSPPRAHPATRTAAG